MFVTYTPDIALLLFVKIPTAHSASSSTRTITTLRPPVTLTNTEAGTDILPATDEVREGSDVIINIDRREI